MESSQLRFAERSGDSDASSVRRSAHRRRTCGAAWVIFWLMCCTVYLAGQNSGEVSPDRLSVADCCKLDLDVVNVVPLPAPVDRSRHQLPRERNTKNRRGHPKYDVTRIGSRGIGEGLNFYSVEREVQLGRQLAAEIDETIRTSSDAIVVEYINRIAQNLVRHSDAKVPFTVKVIDSDEVNAFALPGGFLYVNIGLLLASESEAEFASVIAHEIAHVAARHATKNLTRKRLFDLATLPLMFIGAGAATMIGQAATVAFLKFSRNAEKEADLLGLEYAYAAGYDPSELGRFFERMRKISRENALQVHPFVRLKLREIRTPVEVVRHLLGKCTAGREQE